MQIITTLTHTQVVKRVLLSYELRVGGGGGGGVSPNSNGIHTKWCCCPFRLGQMLLSIYGNNFGVIPIFSPLFVN